MLYLKAEQVESVYQRICKRLYLDYEVNSFSSLISEFSYRIKPPRNYTKFEFTHPSYEEGLVTSWNKIEVNVFIMKMFDAIIKDELPAVRGCCGLILLKNFSDISFKNEAKKLIISVLHDKSPITRYGVVQAIEYYFDEIPSDIALECIEIMRHDRNREMRAAAVSASGRNLGKIPLDKSLEIVSQGLEDRAAWVRLIAVGQVRNNMENFPEQVVTKAISCCRDLFDYTGWFIRDFALTTYSTFEEEFKKLKTHQPHAK